MNTLVLSAGGLYTTAHIGVMRYLKDSNIKIDHCVGCSGGALMAAFWALKWPSTEILKELSSYNWTLYDFNIFNLKYGLIKGDKILKRLKKIFPGNVEDYPITIIASSLTEGKTVAMPGKTPLADAVRASISIPAFFAPHTVDNVEYVDGGVGGLLPLKFTPKESTTIISSKINTNNSQRPGRSIVDIIYDSYAVMVDAQFVGDLEEFNEHFKNYTQIEHDISSGTLLTSFSKVKEYEKIGYENAKKEFEKK